MTKLQTSTKSWKVSDFNEFMCCPICDGYMINPTAVDNCLHTYCRSCIVKHLLHEPYCPLCKSVSKQIDVTNLKSDDVLRAVIYKLVPGLYHSERERSTQFGGSNTLPQQRNGQHRHDTTNSNSTSTDDSNGNRETDTEDDDFFSPTEPISLSLEYHPALLKGCSAKNIPPVRYLQCPAGLKMHHLKRFICSKFDIDPENKRIEVEVIYEDEVLPNDFSLMDVGYCYNWKRHAPMQFTYRIRFCGDEVEQQDSDTHKTDVELQYNGHHRLNDTGKDSPSPAPQQTPSKSSTFTDETTRVNTISSSPPTVTFKSPTPPISGSGRGVRGAKSSKRDMVPEQTVPVPVTADQTIPPVKVIIARKSNDSSKKSSPRRGGSAAEEFTSYNVVNDFKSLRSNDVRYSDYTVTSSTTSTSKSSNSKGNKDSSGSSPRSAQRAPKTLESTATATESANVAPTAIIGVPTATSNKGLPSIPKCDIVVSIPQSQLSRSPYSNDDEYENVSLAQLKTASKKSPNPAVVATTTAATREITKNVPKLKIELNTMRTKLSISKPKSAGVLLDSHSSKHDRSKQRKHSLDEVNTNNDRLDLETYAKNIGLQPIEMLTPPESGESFEKKFSPNASPLSTSSSSTTGSFSNVLTVGAPVYGTELSVPSFHKKRKKKHSKDSNGKRRRMHAEISSQSAEESLKLKLKFTTPHNHKSHKSDSKKHGETASRKSQSRAPANISVVDPVQDDMVALDKTLCEEAQSINNLMMSKTSTHKSKEEKVVRADETILTAPKLAQQTLTKSPNNVVKDTKMPASRPLPPSLFKTTTLNFNTINGQPGTSKSATNHIQVKEKPVTKTSTAAAPKQNSLSQPQFVVPNLPRRSTANTAHTYKYLSTPSSIASSTNKQLQLKRSASLDESYGYAKQQRHESVRKSVYNAIPSRYAQLTGNSATETSPIYGHHNPAISICKISDAVKTTSNSQPLTTSAGAGSSAVTITARPRQQQMPWHMQTYGQTNLPYNKPAVEIVRISSNQLPADLQPLPPLNPPQKGTRTMGPPLSLTKSRKDSTQQPLLHINSTPRQSSMNPYRVSPPALVNLHNAYSNKTTVDQQPEPCAKTNGAVEKEHNSLRHFRRTSHDNNTDSLDITCSQTSSKSANSDTNTQPTTARESLEAALNKLKQNITSTTVADSVSAAAAAKQLQLAASGNGGSDDLQNLHLLSDSATSREKITIRTSQSYEKLKSSQPSMVRQQNASVRNIPNPSALAFRNMATLPVAATTTTAEVTTSATATTVAKKNATLSPTAATQSYKLPASPPNINGKAPLSPPANVTSHTTATVTASTTVRPMKKPTTIDQVAANLNMRAAAAEAHAAKLNAAEEVAQISSSTTSTALDTTDGVQKASPPRQNVPGSTATVTTNCAGANDVANPNLEPSKVVDVADVRSKSNFDCSSNNNNCSNSNNNKARVTSN